MNAIGRICAGVAVACTCLTPAYAGGTKAAIEAVNAQVSAAVAKGDTAALAALYTVDGQVMPAGMDPVRGTDAIQKYWQGGLNAGIGALNLKTTEVYGGGSTASEVGEYDLRDKAGKTIDHGKYIVVWKQVGGKWKLHRDMFSTNVPPKG